MRGPKNSLPSVRANWRAWLSVCALAMILFTTLAAASGQDSPAQQTPPKASKSKAPPASDDKTPPDDQLYVLQRGDDIEIRIVSIPELNQSAKVRPDGRISAILLDDIPAAGLTPTQLGENLSQAYAAHYRNPKVTVIVRSFTNQIVYVGGEVAYPRPIPLVGTMTVGSAIFTAGGLKPTAKFKEVILLRDSGKGQAIVRKLDLKAILTKGSADVQLKPYDMIFVPKTRIARIDQFMDQYVKQINPMNLSLGFSYVLGQQPLIQ